MRTTQLYLLRQVSYAIAPTTRLFAVCSPATHLAPSHLLARSGLNKNRNAGSGHAVFIYSNSLPIGLAEQRRYAPSQRGGLSTGLAPAIGIFDVSAVICNWSVYLLHC